MRVDSAKAAKAGKATEAAECGAAPSSVADAAPALVAVPAAAPAESTPPVSAPAVPAAASAGAASYTLPAFLKGHATTLVIGGVALALVALFLTVFGLDASAIAFVDAVLALCGVLALALEYLRQRAFLRQLERTAALAGRETYLAELLDRPRYLEGEVVYESLVQACKSMNDAIGVHRRENEEYRTYVETWVHEVKTPLSAIDLLVENHPSEIDGALRTELDRVRGYIDQALYYARSSAVSHDYAIAPHSLDALVRAAVRSRSRQFVEAGMLPQFGNLDFQVRTDAKWLDFILGQVLQNALQYRTRTGQPTVRFDAQRLRQGQSDECVVLQVRDNGIGVAVADEARVFDKGFTGENGRAISKSTGIGLFLCRRLCDKMGLGLALTSQQGAWTQVDLSFPLNRLYLVDAEG